MSIVLLYLNQQIMGKFLKTVLFLLEKYLCFLSCILYIKKMELGKRKKNLTVFFQSSFRFTKTICTRLPLLLCQIVDCICVGLFPGSLFFPQERKVLSFHFVSFCMCYFSKQNNLLSLEGISPNFIKYLSLSDRITDFFLCACLIF